jgi:uncharacterized damage-inducible protein DinB
MTFSDLQTLVEYHYWARDRLLEAVAPLTPDEWRRDLGSSFKSVYETVAHIYGAEWAWHQRWLGQSPTALFPAEKVADVARVREAWTELEANVRAFLARLGEDGISRVFDYTLLNGTPGSSPFWQMLQHIVNHASYHRGQVTTMLRQLGVPPGQSMDLIAYYRTRA